MASESHRPAPWPSLLLLLILCGRVAAATPPPAPDARRPLAFESVQLPNGLRAQLLAVPQRFELRVRASAPLLKGSNSSDASLKGLAGLLDGSGTPPAAVLSAGFNREDPLDPVGALIEDRKSLAPLSLATRSNGGIGRRYALSGLLCISRNGQASIETIDSFQASRGACAWGLQAGPLVVERGGAPAIFRGETAASNRLVACEPQEIGRGFEFYYFENSRLAEVEQGLKSRCRSALNLAGAVQAGMLLRPPSGSASVGHIDTPLPSLIVVQGRTR